MKRAPTPWRKKRPGGKFYGNYYVTIDGDDINLRTSNANVALALVPEAQRGRRNFKSDAEAVAEDLEAGAGGAGAQGGGATDNRPRAEGTTPSLPPPSAPPPPAPPPEPPPLPPPPAPSSEEAARAEADATNAAAAETAASSPAAAVANDNAIAIDPDAIKGMLAVGAEAFVELQLGVQAWIIKRKTGKEAGLLPIDSPMRRVAVECWTAQFRRWFPDLDNVPPWILALVVVGSCAPYQLATATPIPKEPEKQAESEPKAAA